MKVIIDIPDNVYEWVMNTGTFGIYRFNTAKAIKNGTPLDEVKAEIAAIYCGRYCENPLTADAMREMIFDIIDNIGKESEDNK